MQQREPPGVDFEPQGNRTKKETDIGAIIVVIVRVVLGRELDGVVLPRRLLAVGEPRPARR